MELMMYQCERSGMNVIHTFSGCTTIIFSMVYKLYVAFEKAAR